METTLPTSRVALRPAALALTCAIALAGCQLGPRPLQGPAALPSGDWAVTALRWGKGNVRNPKEAIPRLGQVIRFEPKLAVSGSDTCRDPVYLANAILADRYLHAEFGLRASDLALYRWQDVRITEVYCQGQRWKALGGEIVWVDDEVGYAVRDNVLYELRRRKPAS